MRLSAPILTSVVLLSSLALGAELDPTTLYKLTTEGTTAKVPAGKKGTFVLEIQSLKGAHVWKPSASTKYPDPRFEVPLTATGKGAGTVEAKVTFFICTADACLRQQKALSVPVAVE